MALDIGDVRIGIAMSDILQIIASPFETYRRSGDLQKDISYIVDLAKAQDVELVVSGLPLKLDGEESLQTEKVRLFVAELEKHNVKTVFVDERLTTVEAEQILIEGNVKRQDRKNIVDKIAASIILQSYLNSK